MTETSALIIPEASALTVDTSRINVSEVESQEDKDFLISIGTSILQEVAHAALKVGHLINKIQKHFEGRKNNNLKGYYESLGTTSHIAAQWACRYRIFQEEVEFRGGDAKTLTYFSDVGNAAAQIIDNLPEVERLKMIGRIGDGERITQKEATAVAQRPEVKQSKAEELLFGAETRAQKAQEVLDNPLSTGVALEKAKTAKRNADISVKNYEQQIADLKAEIEKEKLNTAKENEKNAKLETELQKLKFDDASIRADRVKRVSNQLLVQVPAVLKEVQTFYAEIEHYDANTRDFLEEQLNLLINYTKDHL